MNQFDRRQGGLIRKQILGVYGRHVGYSDGGTWDPESCISLGLANSLHSSYEKGIVERTMKRVSDESEASSMIFLEFPTAHITNYMIHNSTVHAMYKYHQYQNIDP